MNLKERISICKKELVGEVDAFLDLRGENYLKGESNTSSEVQLSELREQMVNRLTYNDFNVTAGLVVIKDMLPTVISESEMENVLNNFREIEGNVNKYFEKSDRSVMPLVDEAMGLSRETFLSIRKLLLHLFEIEDYDRAYKVSLTMVAFFPDNIIGWIGTGRCLSWNGYNKRAIEVFHNIQRMFPKDPVSRIFCGWSYMMVGEPYKSKEQFEKAEEILQQDEKMYNVWEPIILQMKQMF